MISIPTTRLNTPTTIGTALDLCQGFALYPMGTARVGVSAENINFALLNREVKVGPAEAATAHVKVTGGFYAGVCGPAYATDLTVAGTADEHEINLTATESNTFGGLEIGLGLTINYTIEFAGWAIPDIKVQGTTTIDLIEKLISYFIGKIGKKYGKSDLELPSGSSLAAREFGTDLAKAGSVALKPEFHMIVNVAQFIPQLAPIIKFLKKVGGSIDVGPTVNLVLPFQVHVAKFRTAGHEYTVTTTNGNMKGARSADSSVPADEIEVELTHTSSVEFGFGLGFEICVLKFFSIGRNTKPIDILPLVGIHTTTNPVSNRLKAAYGAVDLRAAPHVHEGLRLGAYEVVFEDAAAGAG